MDYKGAYCKLVGQIDEVICELEDECQPIISVIEELKNALLKSEEYLIESPE